MVNKTLHKFGKNMFLIWTLLWILSWVFPWATWLEPMPWVRLGISIIIFATPGFTISLFLVGKRLSLAAHLTSGLAFSVFLVGILGLFGRIFHLPFAYIQSVFALSGLIGLISLIKRSYSEHPLYKPKSFSIVTLISLLLMGIFGSMVAFQSGFMGDHFTYLAYLTNWQHAQSLNFKEVIFGFGTVSSIHFWPRMFIMSLAFLAETSNLHGLLLFGFYIEPFLMVIAILAVYNFYEDLLQSEYQAIAALLLQFTFLFFLSGGLGPGSAFFYRLPEDKAFAAFFLAPVFFLATRCFLESFTPRSIIFFLLSGWSLALTHPVILAYSILIVGLYTSIVIITERNLKKFIVVVALLTVIILPIASLRFLPLAQRTAFDVETVTARYGATNGGRIAPIEGTPFYGFNINILRIKPSKSLQEDPLQYLLSWSYLWILGAGFVWSLLNLKKNITAPFIVAASVLLLLCAIPYTGWLIGYAVSPRMLWRAPWLLPIGLIGVVLLNILLKITLDKILTANARLKISLERAAWSLISVVCVFAIGYFSINNYAARWNGLKNLDRYRTNLESLSALGSYLDKNIEQPSIFVAPRNLMDYLPGLSSKSKIVYFRGTIFTPHHKRVDIEQINRVIFSQDPSIPMRLRMDILNRYNIQYILVKNTALKDYYANKPKFFDIQKVNDFWILKFLGTSFSSDFSTVH